MLPEPTLLDSVIAIARAAGETIPTRLTDLLASSAEVRWLRDRGVTLRLVERALEVGAQVYVTGVAHGMATLAMVESVELAATGTDGATWEVEASGLEAAGGNANPGLWIEADEPLERVLVSSEPPPRDALEPPAWRLALLVLGPLLTLAGLLYLARAAAPLVAGRL